MPVSCNMTFFLVVLWRNKPVFSGNFGNIELKNLEQSLKPQTYSTSSLCFREKSYCHGDTRFCFELLHMCIGGWLKTNEALPFIYLIYSNIMNMFRFAFHEHWWLNTSTYYTFIKYLGVYTQKSLIPTCEEDMFLLHASGNPSEICISFCWDIWESKTVARLGWKPKKHDINRHHNCPSSNIIFLWPEFTLYYVNLLDSIYINKHGNIIYEYMHTCTSMR